MSGSGKEMRSLWEALGEIPDRRGAKGRQYALRPVLVLTLAAMLAGANDLRAIFRWGRRLPKEALYLLGIKRAPCHAMYHYFFKALDVAAAERVLGAWALGEAAPGHVAIDGKRLRGSAAGGHDGSAGVHLLAAFATRLGAVIGQLRVAPEANEITTALAAAQEPAAGGRDHHRRCGVLPARHLPGHPGRGRRLPVHGQGQPAAPDGRYRHRLRRRFPPRS